MFTWYDLIPKHNHDCTYVDQRSSNHIEHTREDWNIKITINLNMPTRRVRVGLQIAFKIRTPGPSRDHNDVDVARSLLCLWHSSVWLCTSMLSCLSDSSRQADYQESHPYDVDSIEICGNSTKSHTPTTSWIATICKKEQTYLEDAFW